MASVLFDEQPLVIDRGLAREIGLNEAIVLQQVHYWIKNNKSKNINYHDGKYWTYNSITKWTKENFSFWSKRTVARIFNNLIDQGYLIAENYNKDKRDKTKWYTINYQKLHVLSGKCNRTNCHNAIGQVDTMHDDNMGKPLPEISTETSTEISNNTVADATDKGSNNSNGFAKVIAAFNQNIHPVTPIESQKLSDWMNDLDPDVIILAIEEAVLNNVRTVKYINRILNVWFGNGWTTKDAVLAHLRDWADKKQNEVKQKEQQQTQGYNSTPSKFVNYKQRDDWDFDELERLEREKIQKMFEEDKED